MQELSSAREIAREVRRTLPYDAFSPDPTRLLHAVVHITVIIWGYVLIRWTDEMWVWGLLSIAVGHSLACLGFVAHDLSHGSVVRRPWTRYLLELLIWGINFVPPTLWNWLHNRLHHSRANEDDDPDRFFFQHEVSERNYKGAVRRTYVMILCPHQFWRGWPIAPYFAGFLVYIFRHLAAVFCFRNSRPCFVAAKPAYSVADIIRIVVETVIAVTFQIAIFHFAGGLWLRYFFASPLAMLWSSAIATGYIWTNHFLRPFNQEYHPILSSTSVQVPALFDWLHSNFSYHSEHHLFPSLPSKWYPEVGKILAASYPHVYQRLHMKDAWRILLSGDAMLNDPPMR